MIPAEAVEATAKAAGVWALTEAATAADNCSPDEADFYKLDRAEVGNWLRARAAEMWEAFEYASPRTQQDVPAAVSEALEQKVAELLWENRDYTWQIQARKVIELLRRPDAV